MLREAFPLSGPVLVRQHPMGEEHGLCWRTDSGVYKIRLRAADPLHIQIDTLLHEWAHAVAFEGDGRWDHTPYWGQAYARLCRWHESLE